MVVLSKYLLPEMRELLCCAKDSTGGRKRRFLCGLKSMLGVKSELSEGRTACTGLSPREVQLYSIRQ